jgi:hypothetical protein
LSFFPFLALQLHLLPVNCSAISLQLIRFEFVMMSSDSDYDRESEFEADDSSIEFDGFVTEDDSLEDLSSGSEDEEDESSDDDIVDQEIWRIVQEGHDRRPAPAPQFQAAPGLREDLRVDGQPDANVAAFVQIFLPDHLFERISADTSRYGA